MDSIRLETSAHLLPDITTIPLSPGKPESQPILVSESPLNPLKIPKTAIRTSLQASTIDAVFAAVFSITTGGILLSNFLVELGASPVVFGMLSSIPMLVNLIQPLGAYFSEKTTSRFRYSMWIYGTSRVLWLLLAVGIWLAGWGVVDSHQLIILTLVIVLTTHLLGGLGGASWLSWLAVIVPRRLRGRYFGIRSSVASLTNLICVPLAGVAVSTWYGGTLQGYGVVLGIGILAGFISLGCQYFKVDINPQQQNRCGLEGIGNQQKDDGETGEDRNTDGNILHLSSNPQCPIPNIPIWQNQNFLTFLGYFGLWMFAVNLSAPFFNFYMLDTLALDVSWVTFYGSIQAGANLLLMVLWGRLADRIGNRSILIWVGILVAITPILWLGVNGSNLDIWLWLPLLHILAGGTWAAIDLCNNNLQLGIAPLRNQVNYFAIAAAVAGASGALGTTIGGFLAENPISGGLPGIFTISCLCRLIALIPLIFIQEPRRKSLLQSIREFSDGVWHIGHCRRRGEEKI
ncbi:major facilitator superfamily MFS_1 [Calothrix sp. NIES-4101]|nr:major facilitator superfamily MFS_1 [Calothrix sp. NIES-4101]